MSTRTIIEINHDYIAQMFERGQIGPELYRLIVGHYNAAALEDHLPGVRVLGTRHHSETLKLEVA